MKPVNKNEVYMIEEKQAKEDESLTGNTLFISLALIVWGREDYHNQMRFWIV